MKGLAIAVSVFAALAVTGCASRIQKAEALHAAIPHESLRNIHLRITNNPQFSSSRGYSESMDELGLVLQEKITSAIPDAHFETSDAAMAAGPGIRITVTVTDFRYVSGTARFLTGVIVGNARLAVKVELSDLETSQKIGESIFGTASSAKEGIFGGTTSRQIDAVSDSIVTMITSAANPAFQRDTQP
jgi:hypothetical protein